jgi:hypothetical protein
MKLSKWLILGILACFLQQYSFAQGKIIFLNGNEKRFSIAEIKNDILQYTPESIGKQPPSPRKVDKYDVFSILNDDGTEEIIYKPDTTFNDDPSIEQVREYIKGEKYASLVYNNPANFVTGMQVGFTSGILLPAFYGLAAPIIYPAVLGRFTPKLQTPLQYQYNPKTNDFVAIPKDTVIAPEVITEYFEAGYGKKARNMKIKSSLIGGAIGFGISASAILYILSLQE